MKKIYFNHLSDWRNGIIIFSALACFLIGYLLEILKSPYLEWNTWLFSMGSILGMIFLLKMVYGRYYVGWNKIGITIRIQSFMGKSFQFKNINSIDLQHRTLMIQEKNGKETILDLSNIDENDLDRLIQILTESTSAKSISHQ